MDTVAETECRRCHSNRRHDAASRCGVPRSHRRDVIVTVVTKRRLRQRQHSVVSKQLDNHHHHQRVRITVVFHVILSYPVPLGCFLHLFRKKIFWE